VISIANTSLALREKCRQANERGSVMKIGIVISGGDVSGMNNFIFQIARQADADITLFNGGIPGLLEKNHQDIAWRDLVDFSITAVPIITSGRTSRKLQRSEYESIAKKLKSLRIDVLIMAGGMAACSFSIP
jgi:6-phosphofructokinase 1